MATKEAAKEMVKLKPKLDTIHEGHCFKVLKTWKSRFIDCCVTSPPYWNQRDYESEGQIGQEKDPQDYIDKLVKIFHQVRRVLKDDGTLWLNLGDSYAKEEVLGLKPKDLIGMPWRVALALQEDGWYLRCDIVWNKPNAMPDSTDDRPTRSHEYVFLFSKSAKYYYNYKAIREQSETGEWASMPPIGGKKHVGIEQGTYSGNTPSSDGFRNKRSVWSVTTNRYEGAHFATYPIKLIKPCILAGSRRDGIVLDPFIGSGTTGVAAKKYGRKYLGIDLNASYIKMAERRLRDTAVRIF